MPEFPNKSTQFKPGQSGNPRGRPRGRSLASTLIEVLDEEAKLKDRQPGHGITKRELLIRNIIDGAIKTNDVGLLRLIFSYHDGKPPETIDLEERIAALEASYGQPASPAQAARRDPPPESDGTA